MSTYKSAAQMLEDARITAETDAKDPGDLLEADLAHLSDKRRDELMDSGQLVRFGIGGRRTPRRY